MVKLGEPKPWAPTSDPATWGLKVGARLFPVPLHPYTDLGTLRVVKIDEGYVWVAEELPSGASDESRP